MARKSLKRQLLAAWAAEAEGELAYARSELQAAAVTYSRSGFDRAQRAIDRASGLAWRARDLSAMGSGALPSWARIEAERRGLTRG